MTTIEVDGEVYRALESRVRSFGETPNTVLRREFGLDSVSARSNLEQSLSKEATRKPKGGKAPKANLQDLVRVGFLANGQVLYMHDYQGNRIDGIEAKVRGNALEQEGSTHSMSALTRKHMKYQGYESDSYRGPQFWYTAEGKSVRDLWDEYLKRY